MMSAFGETEAKEDTLDLMEVYVYEFINNVVHRALAKSQRAGFVNVQLRDLVKVLKQDETKFMRIPYIITCGDIKIKKSSGQEKGGDE